MQEQIGDLDKLLDIQHYSNFVLNHRPNTEEALLEDELLQLGILKALENIGEAAYKISRQTKAEFNQLDWKAMIKARHVYAHDYFRIDWSKIWQSINEIDFEEMIQASEGIIQTIQKRYSL